MPLGADGLRGQSRSASWSSVERSVPMLDCLLVFPPLWIPTSPYLAPASLSAYAKEHGVKVGCVDASIESIDRLLSRKYLASCRATLEEKEELLRKRGPSGPEERRMHLEAVKGLVRGRETPERIEPLKSFLRERKSFGDIERFERAWVSVEDAMFLISQAHYPLDFRFTLLESKYSSSRMSEIIEATEDRDQNVFIEVFEKHILKKVLAKAPAVVGMPVISRNQIVPGMTLAKMVKAASPETAVVVGGPFLSLISSRLDAVLDALPFVDAFVTFDGEEPLVQVSKGIDEHGRLRNPAEMPNLVYRDGGKGRLSRRTWLGDLSRFPTPDFTGFPMGLYLSGRPILPLETSRGCKWRRCAFCDSQKSVSGGYRERDLDRVVDDLRILSERHGTKYFTFVDMSAPAERLDELSKRIVKAGVDVRWSVQTRLAPSLDRQKLERFYASGCRQLFFGLESGSQRMVDLMDKGIRLPVAARILKGSAEAGIVNSAFVMFGFPTESDDDREGTLRFLIGHRDYIDFVEASYFSLFDGTRIATSPARFMLEQVRRAVPVEDSVDEELHYRWAAGQTPADPQQVMSSAEEHLLGKGVRMKYENAFDVTTAPLVLADVHGRTTLRAYMDRVTEPVSFGPRSKVSLVKGVGWTELPFDPYAEGEAASAEGTWLLVRSGRSGSMYVVGKEEGELLSALRRPVEYRKLLDAASSIWGGSARQVEKRLRDTLSEFVARGIVKVA